jgi:phage-related protein
MPDAFPAALIAAKNTLHQANGWRWIVDIDADGTNGYRITDADQPVTYSGDEYRPYPMRIDEIPADGDGTLPQVAMIFASVDDHIATRLNAGHVLDRRIRIRRVNLSDLTVAVTLGIWKSLDATLTYESATLIIGPYPVYDAPFPALKCLRGRCPKVYGGTDCGYNTALPNLIAATYPSFDPSSCDYGLSTGNGCEAHGANEAANGAAVRHPNRFGGFPSIPKGLRL